MCGGRANAQFDRRQQVDRPTRQPRRDPRPRVQPGPSRRWRRSCRVSRTGNLRRTSDWRLIEEDQRAALANIVHGISRLDASEHWGERWTSASDGQRIGMASRGPAPSRDPGRSSTNQAGCSRGSLQLVNCLRVSARPEYRPFTGPKSPVALPARIPIASGRRLAGRTLDRDTAACRSALRR